MLHFLGPAHLTLVYFLSYSVFLSVLIHWKLCLWEIVTLWVKLSGVRLREGRVRKWRARERVREIEDGVALLKDMAETVCTLVLLALEALIWFGLAFPSHPLSLSLSLSNMCGCGMLFHTISTNQAQLIPHQGQIHTIRHLLYSILPSPSLASLIDHIYMHIILWLNIFWVNLYSKKEVYTFHSYWNIPEYMNSRIFQKQTFLLLFSYGNTGKAFLACHLLVNV